MWNVYRICISAGKSVEGSATPSGLQTPGANRATKVNTGTAEAYSTDKLHVLFFHLQFTFVSKLRVALAWQMDHVLLEGELWVSSLETIVSSEL